MNIFTFLKNMRPLVKAGQYTFKQVLQLYKQHVGPVTGIVRKGIENLFKGISKTKPTEIIPWKVPAPKDVTKPFKTGEARWILDKAVKEDLFTFKPEEIEMIKGGRGDILELFRKYYGSSAVRNLPAEGSISAASKFADELKYAVDESGFFANHPKFNKEAIDFKKTRELMKEFGDTIEGHPFTTQSELRMHMREKDWVTKARKKGELAESVPPDTAKVKGPFPRLDPENDSFIILDETGNKMGRYEGRNKIDKETGKGITQWWDRWDAKNNKVLTDSSKYKFSGAMDETGKDIIKSEGVIEGDIISKEGPLTKDKFFRTKQGLSTQIKLNTLPQNKQFAAELVSGKNAEFNTLDKASKKEVLDRLEFNIKKTQSDFADPVKPEDLESGGIAGQLHLNRPGYRVGKIIEAAPKLAKGAAWVIKQLEALIKEARNLGVWSRFSKMGTKDRSEAITSAKEQILSLKSGDPVPESLLDDILTNPKFKLKRSKATDPDLVEVENLVEGYRKLKGARANKFRGEIRLSPNDPSGAYSRNASSALDDYELFTPTTTDMFGKTWKGTKNNPA